MVWTPQCYKALSSRVLSVALSFVPTPVFVFSSVCLLQYSHKGLETRNEYCRQASYGIAHLLHTFISGRTYNEIRCLFGNNTKGNTPVVPSGVLIFSNIALYYGNTYYILIQYCCSYEGLLTSNSPMATPIAPTAIRLSWKKDWTLLWQPCRKEWRGGREGERRRGIQGLYCLHWLLTTSGRLEEVMPMSDLPHYAFW